MGKYFSCKKDFKTYVIVIEIIFLMRESFLKKEVRPVNKTE